MPYDTVRKFEREIAAWTGAKYGISVESGSAAIFLSCLWKRIGEHKLPTTIPARTYPSVPCSIIHAGGTVSFHDYTWAGVYELYPWAIWDAALRFRPGMAKGIAEGLYCLSFHVKKHLPIGRGGMILTDDEDAARWLKRARFDGRGECDLSEDNLTMLGWNMYMTPEQAARGLQLFSMIRHYCPNDLLVADQGYPDLSQYPVYRGE